MLISLLLLVEEIKKSFKWWSCLSLKDWGEISVLCGVFFTQKGILKNESLYIDIEEGIFELMYSMYQYKSRVLA